MNRGPEEGTVRLLALAAGAMDFGTGLGLVFLPGPTLRLMLVAEPGAEALVYVRFVGVFVAAVGFTYLRALLRGRREDLVAALRVTIPFRLGAGTFCLWAAATGRLGPAWLGVTAADWLLAAAQAWILRRWGRGTP
jgi:hypothetical protein